MGKTTPKNQPVRKSRDWINLVLIIGSLFSLVVAGCAYLDSIRVCPSTYKKIFSHLTESNFIDNLGSVLCFRSRIFARVGTRRGRHA